MKKACLTLAALAFASMAMAQLSKYKDWPKSPEADFLTPSERSEWSSVKSDEDAEKFISTYWARRGGDRFKAEVARRIAAADEQFKLRRQRGAESSRGRLLIVLGIPTRVSTSRPGASVTGGSIPDTSGRPGADLGDTTNSAITQTWFYDHTRFDPSLGLPEVTARIVVDQQRGTDEIQNTAEINRAIAQVAEKSIVAAAGQPAAGQSAAPSSPGASVPSPSSSGAPAAGAPAASKPVANAPVGAAPAPATAAIPAAVRANLDALLKSNAAVVPGGAFWGGAFRSVPGEPFYAVELALPADKAAAGIKFAGIVTSDAGGDVASYWEDASLLDMKSGPKAEKIVEKSVVLPPGSYRGAFALTSPDGATTLASGISKFELTAKGTGLEVSPLILASTLTPLTKRPTPTDPFVFGMEKPIRVDPKGSHQFGREESLWYFYTLSNPGIAAAAPAPAAPATPAPVAPASGAPPAPAPATEAPKPRIMATIGVLRDGQPAFAPNTSPAEMQPLSPGYYATGSEIPLSSFEPGFYTFTLRVRDLNAPRDSAAFTGIDRKEDFVVLKPDGGLPEHAAPKQPTPRPKAPAKKS